MADIFITGGARTPIGGFQGALTALTAPELGGQAIKAALNQSGIDGSVVEDVIMGCVLAAGLGQAPARQAGFHGGLNNSNPATTVNKMCGSGMKAVMLGFDQIASGDIKTVVAGGMESMSNAPHLNRQIRTGARIGHQTFFDHMFLDGLEDAYDTGILMGSFAEDCAEHYQFSRAAQDEYALCSLTRASDAQTDGTFETEITPITIETRKQTLTVAQDEQPLTASPEKIPHLKPAFRENGTVTAANSSSISDGAAALVLASSDMVEANGLTVRGRIMGHASFAQAPGWFTTAPVYAAQKLLTKIGWRTDDVDLWEVNEAFAVVPMAFMRELNLSSEIVNIYGGACALGHPIGASGARILVSLINAMERRDVSCGIAAICLGGGEGIAVAVER